MIKKIALVLGGNGGIGNASAERLLKDGMKVYATFFNNSQKISKLKDLYPGDFHICKCDLRNKSDVFDLIKSILDENLKIDVVVFSASNTLHHIKILDLIWEEYQEQIELQLKSMIYLVNSLKDYFKEKKRLKFIVILSEYCIGTPPKGLSAYITSKYAALGFAKSLAVELVQYNCTVNMVSPGMVDTPFLENLPKKLIEITAFQNPMKRIATPNDVSDVVSFLASEKSNYLNGTNITVNGGNIIL
jgi:3-oxoacyl-[acyl-carrier protein] reductase